MSTYIGFYRATPEFTSALNAHDLGLNGATNVRAGLTERVRGLMDALPDGCRLVNAYAPTGAGAVVGEQGFPGVMVIETENAADLAAISTHYGGYLSFQWSPVRVSGATREERSTFAAQSEGRAPVRAG
jgi:hypothetical protein